MNKICDECETVAHCTKHGCIPKVSAKDAMKLALEALEGFKSPEIGSVESFEQCEKAITVLQEALAEQPAQQREPDLSGLKPSTQEVIKGWIEDGTFIQRAIGAMQEQEAENMRLEKMAAPQPAQQEQIYQYQMANGSWIDQTKESHDYNVRHGQATVRVVYTSPPAQRKPLTDWVNVDERLPEKGGYYLVTVDTDDGPHVDVLLFNEKRKHWEHEGEPTFCHSYFFNPTHWANRPEAAHNIK